MPDSLRAYAESVSQFKAAQKREKEEEEQRRLLQNQQQRKKRLQSNDPGRFSYQDYTFHNNVRRSGLGLNRNSTMSLPGEELKDFQTNSVDKPDSAESSHAKDESDYDYEYDYEDDEDSGNDETEGSDEGPEYYYYYYYEYPDEGIDISHEMESGKHEPIYEPLPTPLWQKAPHINSTAEEDGKSESSSES